MAVNNMSVCEHNLKIVLVIYEVIQESDSVKSRIMDILISNLVLQVT